MGPVRSSMQRWNAKTTRLAVKIGIVLPAFALAACALQEPIPPGIVAEFTKQDKIYQSRGADVPAGYVTGRALSDYAQVLASGFCDALGRLASSDRWLDIGAGEGQAILDYYSLEENTVPTVNCARSLSKARAVALSIEDRRTEKWRQQAAIFGSDRILYLAGKRLRNYSLEELGKFQIITDVFGGFSYTEDLSQFVTTVLNLLEVGGAFYTVVQSVHLENGKDNPNTWYLTELVDPAGRQEKVCSWLRKSACVQVSCESKSDWDTPTELIHVRKVCSDVAVPRTKLLKFEAGNPPGRRFQLEP